MLIMIINTFLVQAVQLKVIELRLYRWTLYKTLWANKTLCSQTLFFHLFDHNCVCAEMGNFFFFFFFFFGLGLLQRNKSHKDIWAPIANHCELSWVNFRKMLVHGYNWQWTELKWNIFIDYHSLFTVQKKDFVFFPFFLLFGNEDGLADNYTLCFYKIGSFAGVVCLSVHQTSTMMSYKPVCCIIRSLFANNNSSLQATD